VGALIIMKIKTDRLVLLLYLVPLLALPYYANEIYKLLNYLAAVLFFAYEALVKVKKIKIHTFNKLFFGYPVWLVVFSLFVVLASFWSNNRSASLSKALILFVVVIGQIALLLWSNFDLKRVEYIINMSLLIASVILIKTILTTPFSALGYQDLFSAYTGFDKNGFAMMGAFLSVCALYEYFKSGNKKYIVYWMLMFAMAIIGASRKGALIAIISWPMMVVLKNKPSKKVAYIGGFSILALIGVYFMLTNETLYSLVGERLSTLFLSLLNKESSDGSIAERTVMRRMAMMLFNQKKILGWGTDGFAIQTQQFWGRYVYSHCNYTELLCNFGVVGFALFYSFPVRVLILLIKKMRTYKIAYVFSFIIFFMYTVFEYGLVSYYSPIPFFMKTLAIIVLSIELKGKSQHERDD